jgi:peptidoglycan/LPS O-acetylase OafA/YrhL
LATDTRRWRFWSAGLDRTHKISQLEGLRAVAVFLVIVQHNLRVPRGHSFTWWQPGAAGVRLFFVLSGFLITGILLRAREDAATAGVPRSHVLRAFYGRRCLRIFPLAYLAILVVWLLGLPAARQDGWWYASYLANIRVAQLDDFPKGLGHFWSLAIEEQFYLIWPALILWTPRRWMAPALASVAVCAVLARGGIVAMYGEVPGVVLTVARLDALGLGGLLAWATHARRVPRGIAWWGIGLIVVGEIWRASHPMLGELGLVLVDVWIISRAAEGIRGPIGRTLGHPVLVYLGGLSYGIYVWHYIAPDIVEWLQRITGRVLWFPWQLGWRHMLYIVVVTLPIAAMSWHLFEKPINDLKRRVPYVPKRDERNAIQPS